jgi:hypothetical protein
LDFNFEFEVKAHEGDIGVCSGHIWLLCSVKVTVAEVQRLGVALWDRPEVGKVITLCPIELSVVRSVFAEKVGTVRGVDCVKAEPIGFGWVGVRGVKEGGDLWAGVVVVAATEPLTAHFDAVDCEELRVPSPHVDGGM